MLTALASLKNRVFLACAFVAVLSIAIGTHFVTARVSDEAEAELDRELLEAAELLEEHHAARSETLALIAWLIADLPKLKAAVATGDGPTVEPLARDYQARTGADVLIITDEDGRVLAATGTDEPWMVSGAVAEAREGGDSAYFQSGSGGLLEIVTLPISIGPEPAEVLGTLSIGFYWNDRLAGELGALTQSEIVILAEDRAVASTLSLTEAEVRELARADHGPLALGDAEYVAIRRALAPADNTGTPLAVLLRSRSERLSFLRTFREGLLLAALFGVLLAIVLSYAVARTVTRPLAAIIQTMREITSTGDLTRKIELRDRWVDEDATLLARAFNGLTDAIARFQREAASKERLSALGRMSAVLAHEIRNPLMIIKGSLPSLRRGASDDAREAASDIEHEVARLNRMVGDVLDFARPVEADLKPTDVNAVCREALDSVVFEPDSTGRVEAELDPSLPEILSDGERLRTALVNVLSNARDAVRERREGESSGADGAVIELRTSVRDDRISIRVRDRGPGIDPEDLPKIFEPYFTGKRTGTGLGLAITKNIVESLGGTVTAESFPAEGTEIRIELIRRVAQPSQPVTASLDER